MMDRMSSTFFYAGLILASGGKGLLWGLNGSREWTEADVAVESLLSEGVERGDITKDMKAETTVGNFQGAIDWINSNNLTDLYVATNACHMFRVMAIANRVFREDYVHCNLHRLSARVRSPKDFFAELGVFAYESLYVPPREILREPVNLARKLVK